MPTSTTWVPLWQGHPGLQLAQCPEWPAGAQRGDGQCRSQHMCRPPTHIVCLASCFSGDSPVHASEHPQPPACLPQVCLPSSMPSHKALSLTQDHAIRHPACTSGRARRAAPPITPGRSGPSKSPGSAAPSARAALRPHHTKTRASSSGPSTASGSATSSNPKPYRPSHQHAGEQQRPQYGVG